MPINIAFFFSSNLYSPPSYAINQIIKIAQKISASREFRAIFLHPTGKAFGGQFQTKRKKKKKKKKESKKDARRIRVFKIKLRFGEEKENKKKTPLLLEKK